MYFNVKIADVIIGVNYKYDYTFKVFSDYIVSNELTPAFTVNVTDEMIEFERKVNEKFPPSLVENIAVFRYIAKEVIKNYNCILFHSSAIAYDDNAFLFTAKSGTGKSTHVKMLANADSKISYVNDDKPFIRYFENENKFYVYGTPWMGKHNLGSNVRVPLKAVCFLTRGETNSITKVNPLDYLNEIFTQTVKPNEVNSVDSFTNVISALTTNVDFYLLKCNLHDDAPLTSLNGMIKKYAK
ncbi:MAG: hypothetical protein J6R88_01435 [Clostridia bacterium]|nr:hypothetical protein [Clostridia bacterium]